MWVYINYPNPKFSIHKDPGCSIVRMHEKEEQRVVRIDQNTLPSVLERFRNQRYKFMSQAEYNDMWLEFELASEEDEIKAVKEIKKFLGSKYLPLSRAELIHHC